ncbi:hypothetical protein [Bacteroides sp.]
MAMAFELSVYRAGACRNLQRGKNGFLSPEYGKPIKEGFTHRVNVSSVVRLRQAGFYELSVVL